MNKDKIKDAVKIILEEIGEDPNRDGLIETPDRVARMYEEIFSGYKDSDAKHMSKQFSCKDGELVIVKDIGFYSMCEHHLLPFYGKAHIAYIPDGKVVGLSKLARTVNVFSRRLQIQEQMTQQIAQGVAENLKPKGTLVIVEAEHMCMTMRGVKNPGSKTTTIATRGIFAEDPSLKDSTVNQIFSSNIK